MTKKLAFIFDLDGTLLDSEIIHARAESELVSRYGIILTPEQISTTYAGIPTETYIAEVVGNVKTSTELIKEKDLIVDEILRNEKIHPVAGMLKLIEHLYEKKVPIFIASSSSVEWIKRCLGLFFIENGRVQSYGDYFGSNFVSGSEVPNPKPSPDIFLEAKKRMQKAYKLDENIDVEWIVVGDSMADLNAASEASMLSYILNDFSEEFGGSNFVKFVSNGEEILHQIMKE